MIERYIKKDIKERGDRGAEKDNIMTNIDFLFLEGKIPN